jgi:hypothetical protein
MITLGERKRGIDDFLAELIKTLYPARMRETIEYTHKHKSEIIESLALSLTAAAASAKGLFDSGMKQKVQYIQFSYLFSAALMKELRLRVDLYDNRHYGDLSEAVGYWDYSGLFPYIDRDMAILKAELAKRFTRVMDYELTDIRLHYHIWIFALAESILTELVTENAFLNALTDVFDVEVSVLFGAYLDQSEVIATLKRAK